MKTTNKAIAWIIVVFVLGALSGSALTYLVYQPKQPPWADRRSRGDRSPDKFVQLISEKLALDESQQEQFRTLMIESRDQFRAARHAVRIETRQKLEKILSLDQLQQLDEMMEKTPRHHPLGRGRGPE